MFILDRVSSKKRCFSLFHVPSSLNGGFWPRRSWSRSAGPSPEWYSFKANQNVWVKSTAITICWYTIAVICFLVLVFHSPPPLLGISHEIDLCGFYSLCILKLLLTVKITSLVLVYVSQELKLMKCAIHNTNHVLKRAAFPFSDI